MNGILLCHSFPLVQSSMSPLSLREKQNVLKVTLFGVFTFFQKRKQMKKSPQVVKLNLFVQLLEETLA